MIYTLDYIKHEATALAGSWNGEDAQFVDHNGDRRDQSEAQAALELLEQIKAIEESVRHLGI